MPYRSAEAGSRSSAVWGPIAPRFLRIAFGALCLVIALLLSVGAGSEQSLRCERRAEEATCTLARSAPFFGDSVASFPESAIAEVRVSERTTKGGAEYDLKFLDSRGAEHFLGTFDERGDADAERRRIERFLSTSGLRELVVESAPDPFGMIAVAACVAVALGCIVNALWATGRFRFVLDRAKNELSIRRSILGLPIGRMDLHASDVEQVFVEYGFVPDWAKTKYARPEPGGRVVLVTASGNLPLAHRFLRGTDVHERGARDLRALLDLPAREPSREPSPSAAIPRRKSLSMILKAAFAIVGLVIGAFVANLILNEVAMQTQGRLDLAAEHRCRFQGMELLPGGAMQTTLDPGRYEVEIWQPGDRWVPEEFLIVQDGRRSSCAARGERGALAATAVGPEGSRAQAFLLFRLALR